VEHTYICIIFTAFKMCGNTMIHHIFQGVYLILPEISGDSHAESIPVVQVSSRQARKSRSAYLEKFGRDSATCCRSERISLTQKSRTRS
jgi:hypothetical protein